MTISRNFCILGGAQSCSSMHPTQPAEKEQAMPKPIVISLPPRVKDRTGHKLGRLTVMSFSHLDKGSNACWKCKCKCGNKTVVQGSNLNPGRTSSCGCLAKEITRKRSYKHGHSIKGLQSAEYQAWHSMKVRCANKNHPAYRLYGGRGITVCKKWRDSFPTFLADVGPKPSSELTLDRIDNNSGYRPGNVRWASWTVQVNNRRPSSEWDKPENK